MRQDLETLRSMVDFNYGFTARKRIITRLDQLIVEAIEAESLQMTRDARTWRNAFIVGATFGYFAAVILWFLFA